jgi:hypothetical protein
LEFGILKIGIGIPKIGIGIPKIGIGIGIPKIGIRIPKNWNWNVATIRQNVLLLWRQYFFAKV